MLKDATYKEKFVTLSQWLPSIVESIKKDLKNEHLKRDLPFVRQYFMGKNPNKLTTEELAAAYSSHMANGDNTEELGEFITNRWLLKHTDVYDFFEQELHKINPKFHELDILDGKTSLALMEKAIAEFGPTDTYLFCVLNSVVFPADVYKILQQKAKEHAHHSESVSKTQMEKESLETLHRNYQQQIARLTDKYEKKISGLQKKYLTDIESLKKQIATLQRKLHPQ